MSYPPPIYHGDAGEVSAHVVRADVEPAVVYPNGNKVFYLAQGTETQGTFGLYRWEFAGPPSGPDAHFHRTSEELYLFTHGAGRLLRRLRTRPVACAASNSPSSNTRCTGPAATGSRWRSS